MPVGATIGSAVIGGAASIYGANKAASTQAKAANRAAKLEAPFTNVGTGAMTTLGALYGIGPDGQPTQPFNAAALEAFKNSPDYQFAFNEGQRALEFSNAAKGGLLSGNNMRDLTTFGQGMATQNFGNYANRLLQLAGIGQNAAAGQGNQINNAGQAQASGIVGMTNALNSSLGGAANNLMLYNLLNGQNNPSAYAGSTGSYNFSNPTMMTGGIPFTM
jgi:hypothetical protein